MVPQQSSSAHVAPPASHLQLTEARSDSCDLATSLQFTTLKPSSYATWPCQLRFSRICAILTRQHGPDAAPDHTHPSNCADAACRPHHPALPSPSAPQSRDANAGHTLLHPSYRDPLCARQLCQPLHALAPGRVTPRTLAKVAGRIVSVRMALTTAPLLCRYLWRLATQAIDLDEPLQDAPYIAHLAEFLSEQLQASSGAAF